MIDLQSDTPPPEIVHFSLRAFLIREWPYLLVLILAFIGVAYTSFSKAPMTLYWMILTPFIGLICVVTRWGDAESQEQRLRLIRTQAVHWGAVFVAMRLMFLTDVSRMMNANASALSAMTLLAPGTFTAGLHIQAWNICLIGIILAIGVPAISWLEQSALLLFLVALVVAAVIGPLFWHHKKQNRDQPLPSE